MSRGSNVNKRGNDSKLLCILKSLLVSYIATAMMLLVLAGLLYKMNLNEKTVTIGIVFVYIIATLIGGIILGKMMKMRRFLWGLCLGICYFLLLVLITLGVYHTIDTGGVQLISTFVLCAGGGMIGGMIS